MSLTVHPPDVNESVYAFKVAGPDEHPFRARRHQGRGRLRRAGHRRRARRAAVPIESLPELCRRIDLQRVNRRVLEALIKSGSLDRARPESRHAHRRARSRDASGRAKFARHERGTGGPVRLELAAAEHGTVADWTEAQRLAGERETLGLYLSGHPITPYEPDLKFLVSARLVDVGGPKPVAGAGRARLEPRQAGHRRRTGARDPPPSEPGDLDPGRSQRAARGEPVRGDLPAVPRHHRQGRDPHRRGHAAVRRFHRGLAPAGEKRSWTSTGRASASRGACGCAGPRSSTARRA